MRHSVLGRVPRHRRGPGVGGRGIAQRRRGPRGSSRARATPRYGRLRLTQWGLGLAPRPLDHCRSDDLLQSRPPTANPLCYARLRPRIERLWRPPHHCARLQFRAGGQRACLRIRRGGDGARIFHQRLRDGVSHRLQPGRRRHPDPCFHGRRAHLLSAVRPLHLLRAAAPPARVRRLASRNRPCRPTTASRGDHWSKLRAHFQSQLRFWCRTRGRVPRPIRVVHARALLGATACVGAQSRRHHARRRPLVGTKHDVGP
mmetsp:Transcript_5800/g.18134  ORF Transcript_5800/g.18134 Transcript_5800/m.18134 type:complete len:258 (+) Transcript_5800:1491-2264(+)